MSKYHTITNDYLGAVGTLLIGSTGIIVHSPPWQVNGKESFPRTFQQASTADQLTSLPRISLNRSVSVDQMQGCFFWSRSPAWTQLKAWEPDLLKCGHLPDYPRKSVSHTLFKWDEAWFFIYTFILYWDFVISWFFSFFTQLKQQNLVIVLVKCALVTRSVSRLSRPDVTVTCSLDWHLKCCQWEIFMWGTLVCNNSLLIAGLKCPYRNCVFIC